VVTVTDNGGLGASGSTSITVDNVAPTVTSANGPVTPQPINTSVTVAATYTDPGSQDSHVCSFDWDDSTTTTSPGTSGTCSSSKSFSNPGVYSVNVTVKDDDNGSGSRLIEQMFIVVYDPNGGFVTGGGFIDSPAGASLDFPTAVGKANFGFVSKYIKGSNTPEGQTEFQFKAGDLNFHSSAYDIGSLVISSFKAQYKGTGTVNGQSGYRFVLTAYDGQINGGGGTDKFRIKIIGPDNSVVYDNARGSSDDVDTANPIAISGGSVVIHKGK